MPDFKCNDDRPCFGRKEDGLCDVLREPFKNKPCPFCKPKRFRKADGSKYHFPDVTFVHDTDGNYRMVINNEA
jgi:hypothetical protein